ncbi:hypothetical protein [Mucisphaera calidilacus]|uniref:Uncharacterized protein n=1 Tax=Mucisphaera calidilacus TaxID=2527982 RepID=A0A518BVG3_9BACT|nr:hypothetical protein [Mucisphaera calidilacus]QDU70937.1 hypothetical protein Pan265_07810 [Mucisphaera calidilacus]
MDRHAHECSRLPGWAFRWLLVTALLLPAWGCQSAPSRAERVASHLEAATVAIQTADLELAKLEIAAAASESKQDRERERVSSLAYLVAGSEAVMEGDARLAGAYWSNISDPGLRAQVAQSADRLRVTVPDTPVAVPEPPHHDGGKPR